MLKYGAKPSSQGQSKQPRQILHPHLRQNSSPAHSENTATAPTIQPGDRVPCTSTYLYYHTPLAPNSHQNCQQRNGGGRGCLNLLVAQTAPLGRVSQDPETFSAQRGFAPAAGTRTQTHMHCQQEQVKTKCMPANSQGRVSKQASKHLWWGQEDGQEEKAAKITAQPKRRQSHGVGFHKLALFSGTTGPHLHAVARRKAHAPAMYTHGSRRQSRSPGVGRSGDHATQCPGASQSN